MAACGSLWRPVAACGSRMDSPIYIDFLDFGGILTCWMMNARLMEAKQRLGGCWMMNGRQIGRSSHTLELEELGGFSLIIISETNVLAFLRVVLGSPGDGP